MVPMTIVGEAGPGTPGRSPVVQPAVDDGVLVRSIAGIFAGMTEPAG